MSEKPFEIPKNPEGVEIANRFRDVLKQTKINEKDYAREIDSLTFGGKSNLKAHLESNVDKYRFLPKAVEAFLETEIFDVDETGVNVVTPWNGSRRRQAGKTGW